MLRLESSKLYQISVLPRKCNSSVFEEKKISNVNLITTMRLKHPFTDMKIPWRKNHLTTADMQLEEACALVDSLPRWTVVEKVKSFL